jgi:hypothetical protein
VATRAVADAGAFATAVRATTTGPRAGPSALSSDRPSPAAYGALERVDSAEREEAELIPTLRRGARHTTHGVAAGLADAVKREKVPLRKI